MSVLPLASVAQQIVYAWPQIGAGVNTRRRQQLLTAKNPSSDHEAELDLRYITSMRLPQGSPDQKPAALAAMNRLASAPPSGSEPLLNVGRS